MPTPRRRKTNPTIPSLFDPPPMPPPAFPEAVLAELIPAMVDAILDAARKARPGPATEENGHE